MRATPLGVCLLALVSALPTPALADEPAGLRIVELLAIPDAAQGQREFVELWNAGNHTVPLAGWSLRDAPTASGSVNEYTFTSGSLAPGARIVVWSNGTPDARGPSWSTSAGKAVWNDAGDAATLLDPGGNVRDWLAYGNAAQPAPSGFEGQPKPSASAKGLSLQWKDGTWTTAAPTPALAPGAVGGFASATVQNVAPAVHFVGLPSTVQPGATVSVQADASDDNGANDIVAWSLSAAGTKVAQGTALPIATAPLVAPATSGPWILRLTVTDAAGSTGNATATVQVRDARLSVTLAGGILRFPDLAPGAVQVTALGWAKLRNEGSDPVVPLLDVAAFTGSGSIPVDGNLDIGLASTPGGNATWTPYQGALTALPLLAPGTEVHMTFRLREVPRPLAAGAYGTTFAVVAT
jgi:hypothetical protein